MIAQPNAVVEVRHFNGNKYLEERPKKFVEVGDDHRLQF